MSRYQSFRSFSGNSRSFFVTLPTRTYSSPENRVGVCAAAGTSSTTTGWPRAVPQWNAKSIRGESRRESQLSSSSLPFFFFAGSKLVPTISWVASSTPHTTKPRASPCSAAELESAEMYAPMSSGFSRFRLNSSHSVSCAADARPRTSFSMSA